MENNKSITDIAQLNEAFTEKWFVQELSLVTGLYHLTYDGQWHCEFASDNCFKILNCTSGDFLKSFQELSAAAAYGAPEKTVGTMLSEIVDSPESRTFISVRPLENDSFQYIKGTFAASQNPDGSIGVYGQISDVSGEKSRDAHFQDVEEEFQSSLKMSGSTIYRYLIDGRRAIIPPMIAKRRNIPELIDNMPEWNVECGHIAPQSVDTWLGIFEAIDRGEKYGAADVIFSVRGGELLRRGRVEFVGMTDKNGTPVGATVSHKDITDEYEYNHKQALDRAGLLQVAQMTFPEILSLNLTKGTYRMIQYHGATTLGTPQEGPLDQLLLPRLENIAPEDQEAFRKTFFLENLLKAISEGKNRMQLTYRRRGADGIWHWMETINVRQPNPYDDDILTFAVSRSIDDEKAQENRLREKLRQQSEELNITISQIGNHISYYDIPTGTLTTLPSTAKKFGVPLVMENYPESFLENPPEGYPPETGEILRSFIGEIRQGKPKGFCKYPTVTAEGQNVWLHREFVTIFDDLQKPVRAVISSKDVTENYTQKEENRQLKEQIQKNEQIFNLVAQHSNRTLYAYDLETCTTRSWNSDNQKNDILAHLYTSSYTEEKLAQNQSVLPDSTADVKKFFSDIHSGVPSGELNIHVRLTNGEAKWFHFRYSNLFVGDCPTTALISVGDITEDYTLQVSHMRLQQALEAEAPQHLCYIEADLTDDLMENSTGVGIYSNIPFAGKSYSMFLKNYYFGLVAQDCDDAHIFYTRENLLTQYNQGVKHLENLWRSDQEKNGASWVMIKADLIADPFSKHIKMFARMLDVSTEQEELIAINKRADFDAMTGLLRKDVGEERIKNILSENREKGGILITLDLDDLKGINDNLGHNQGDIAIKSIADTLKNHFRRDDILIRSGGDEFIAFLPGAGQGASTVEISMSSLLRKLSSISIGERNERTIHCSAGGAVEIPGVDTYESLFKRADLALYHVKRSGKNNFAFYTPEMTQTDYEFRSKQLLSIQNTKKFNMSEMQHLLNSIASFYQLVLQVNLSANTYYMMEEVEDGVFSRIPSFGVLNEFVNLAAKPVHPEDLNSYMSHLSRESLLQAYELGKQYVRHHFRFLDQGHYRWIECIVIFYTNEQGDICDFTLLRWADERASDLELLRLKKMLGLSVTSDFEYICLINVRSKNYSTFSRDRRSSHAIPEFADFDMLTKHIRDTQLPPNARDAYYENASLDNILHNMQELDSCYSYSYTTTDGITHQVFFNWYEESHSELLMLVRKIT